jgi:hypothetical protein
VTVELDPGGDAVLALLVATAPLRLHRSSSVPVVLRPTASAEAGGRIVVDVEVDGSSRRVGGIAASDAEAFWAELSGEVLHWAPRPPGIVGPPFPARTVGWLTRPQDGNTIVLPIGLPKRLAPHRSAPGDTCRARPRPGRVLHEPLSGVRGAHGRLPRPHRPRDGATRPDGAGRDRLGACRLPPARCRLGCRRGLAVDRPGSPLRVTDVPPVGRAAPR